ncbi:MAG: VanW family protein [Polyangiaceae bacterium]
MDLLAVAAIVSSSIPSRAQRARTGAFALGALVLLAWGDAGARAPGLDGGHAASALDGGDAASRAIRLVHGDAAVELTASELGVRGEISGGERLSWDASRRRAACDALAGELALAEPFDGDLDLEGDAPAVLAPKAGEAVDCDALAREVELAVAHGARFPTIDVPVIAREPRTGLAELTEIARSIEPLLHETVTILVTHEGASGGLVTLAPDDVRRALRVVVRDGRARAELSERELSEVLAPALRSLGEPARDARIEEDAAGNARVVPGRRGLRVDGGALLASAGDAAKKTTKKSTVAATKSEPAVTTAKAEALKLKGVAATYTTRYVSGQPRVKNIQRAAALLDNAIVEPGDRFSLNQRIGKRTAKRGFVLAPSIGEGEIIDTYGGGVSQTATTLYNAVFEAGYAVVSRKPHTRYFDRYPVGVEATLSWPKPDFVFRNDSKTGVLIKVTASEDSITVKLYGDAEGRKVKRNVSKTFDPTDPRVDYEVDEALAVDKPKVKDAGTKGFSVKVGRDITFADGTKKHEERTVIYHGRPRVIAAHPCAIPKGEKGHRSKPCPEPEPEVDADAVYDEPEPGADKAAVAKPDASKPDASKPDAGKKESATSEDEPSGTKKSDQEKGGAPEPDGPAASKGATSPPAPPSPPASPKPDDSASADKPAKSDPPAKADKSKAEPPAKADDGSAAKKKKKSAKPAKADEKPAKSSSKGSKRKKKR